jgi:hypothetical protein
MLDRGIGRVPDLNAVVIEFGPVAGATPQFYTLVIAITIDDEVGQAEVFGGMFGLVHWRAKDHDGAIRLVRQKENGGGPAAAEREIVMTQQERLGDLIGASAQNHFASRRGIVEGGLNISASAVRREVENRRRNGERRTGYKKCKKRY